ncbi:hypothetical protein BJV74DRAFT_766950 [Russula compacta]|nr:hypothetical protein BJV74DRAFT_766950 [Russula compacta]
MSGQTRAGSARLNAYHGTKRQLIGTSAGQVAPAWRTLNGTGGTAATNGNIAPPSKKALQRGSKILLSNLPMDVAEAEVEELFKRTVGAVKDMFMIHNNQGRSKGMAIVTFHRPTDAGVARSKYDGKVIDGKHKLKIELVTDSDEFTPHTIKEQTNAPPSLLSRIAGSHIKPASDQIPNNTAAVHPCTPCEGESLHHLSPPRQHPAKRSPISIVVSGPRKRTKKGPKRVKKSLAQLDQEMEEYRASATDGKGA